MRRMLTGALLGLLIFGVALGTSYVVLNHFYGARETIASTQTMTIEDSGQQITTDTGQFGVESAELTTVNNTSYYRLLVSPMTPMRLEEVPEDMAPAPATGGEESKGPSEQFFYIEVPSSAYDQAVETGEPVTVTNITLTETKPIDTLPIAASIGIAAGLVAIAIWVGYRQAWGEATSTLLERGLHDMTVRDVEIVGYTMERGEFTIPELMKLSSASKITVWRTVQKLVESGLVEETENRKLAANGLGGRGKPSRIYKYVGEKGKTKKSPGPAEKVS